MGSWDSSQASNTEEASDVTFVEGRQGRSFTGDEILRRWGTRENSQSDILEKQRAQRSPPHLSCLLANFA